VGLTGSAATAVAQPVEPPVVGPEPAPSEPAPVTEPAPPLPAPEPDPELVVGPDLASNLQIHGFVTQGAFVSTANDYLGKSSRGSFELFEAGLNVSKEVADRLRAGVQLFSRDVGKLGNYALTIDWAFIDYRYRQGQRSSKYGGYENTFLSGGAKWAFTKSLHAQFAASQSIGRPGYNNLAGVITIDEANQTVRIPNPDLKPETSDKYFASLQYSLEPAGTLSVAGFRLFVENMGSAIRNISA
jgi:outer membrane receptor protein involved in Fe transport